MEPYKYRSGEVWGGDDVAPGPSPLPTVEEGAGKRLARRARRAKTDPTWRERTREERDLALRVDALDERQVPR